MQKGPEDGLMTDSKIAAQSVVGKLCGSIHCQVVGPFGVFEELIDVC
jgi:hypothetical protein